MTNKKVRGECGTVLEKTEPPSSADRNVNCLVILVNNLVAYETPVILLGMYPREMDTYVQTETLHKCS